ncbi:MAG: DUF2283 domain-containing protein [Bacteroidetes bacterium]|nr:DUF2283 domain-containing protein [Bacteroidota bacterium]
MKIKYDKETDVLYIQLSSLAVAESDQEKQGIIIDFASNNQIVGIEILNASANVDQVNGVLYEMTNG